MGSTPHPFYGRADILSLIGKKLTSSKEGGVVIGLQGDAGCGKSAILRECLKMTDCCPIMVDFRAEQDSFKRLMIIAEGARVKKLRPLRFDRLCDMREWFLDGKVRGSSKDPWFKDLMKVIPVIGQAGDIAVNAFKVGQRLNKLINDRHAGVGKWLTQHLGKDHGAELLKLLAGVVPGAHDRLLHLFMQALVDDIQLSEGRPGPVLLLFDEFDSCEHSTIMEMSYDEVPVNEYELWQLLFSRPKGFMLVVAGRALPGLAAALGIARTLIDADELDHDGCLEIVEHGGVSDPKRRELIVEICHRNPYMIWAMLDDHRRGELSLDEIESLKSDKLSVVRRGIWNLFTRRTPSLARLVKSAALVPFFDELVLRTIHPDLGDAEWAELMQLSFVEHSKPWWWLRDLVRELALADCGEGLRGNAEKAHDALLEAGEKREDRLYQGLAVSVHALADERAAVDELEHLRLELLSTRRYKDILEMIDVVRLESDFGRAVLLHARGQSLLAVSRVAEAESDLETSRRMFERLAEHDSSVLVAPAAVAVTLGTLYATTGRPKRAESSFGEALKIYRRLAETGSKLFESDVATTLEDLATLCADTSRPQDAERFYNEALEIQRRLAKTAPEQFEPDVADTLNHLAALYAKTGRPHDAERFHIEALDAYGRLAKTAPKQFEPDVADTLVGLGMLYSDTSRPQDAERSYSQAIEVYRRLAKTAPEQFEPHVATALDNLATLCADTSRAQDAERFYNEALEIRRRLAKTAPELFQSEVADTLNNLAALYAKTGRPHDAETSYSQALETYMRLAKTAPEQFEPYVATTLNNLGVLYADTDRPEDAERSYSQALETRRRLAETAPEQFEHYVATTLINLGNLYRHTDRLQAAEEFYIEALDAYRHLAKTAPEEFGRYLATTLNYLGMLYVEMGRPEKAEIPYVEAMEILFCLAKRAPAVFSRALSRVLDDLRWLYIGARGQSEEEARSKVKEMLARADSKCRDYGL